MRIWDIIDQLQPGVEITQRVDTPVRFASPTSSFTLSVAGLILATASAFWLPIPRQAAVVSATTQARNAPATTPPLSFFGNQVSDEGVAEQDNELLDKIELAQNQTRPDDILRLDILEANQQESLKQPPAFTRSQVSSILKKRRVG
jgi:hypothetical protein